MSASNNREIYKQHCATIFQDAAERYMNEIIIPQLEKGLQSIGLNVNREQLDRILELPASQAVPATSPATSNVAHRSHPTTGGFPTTAGTNQPSFLQPTSHANFDGDNYSENGCLYYSKRGNNKFIFCGAPTADGSPVCKACSNKRDGEKLIGQWRNGAMPSVETIRSEAAARRMEKNEPTSGQSKGTSRGNGKKTAPESLGNGFTISKPPPPQFVPQQPVNSAVHVTSYYSQVCPWRPNDNSLYFNPSDHFIVNTSNNGYMIVGRADSIESPIRKLNQQEYNQCIQQGWKVDSNAVQTGETEANPSIIPQQIQINPQAQQPQRIGFSGPLLPPSVPPSSAGTTATAPSFFNFNVPNMQPQHNTVPTGTGNPTIALPSLPQGMLTSTGISAPKSLFNTSYPQPPVFSALPNSLPLPFVPQPNETVTTPALPSEVKELPQGVTILDTAQGMRDQTTDFAQETDAEGNDIPDL